jgi:ribosomal protein L3 glutamine methyltransferase
LKRAAIQRRLARARLHFGHGAKSAAEEAQWFFSFSSKHKFNSKTLLERRIRERIPLAYLLREGWLAGRRFYVDERALVPRSFIAELLHERLSPWLVREPRRVLDLCTGSGCLAILLALTFRKCRVDASDISADALEVARINVRKYRLDKRVRLIRSDLFASVKGRYDLIVCNPPYVTARSMRRLPKEYRYEPRIALEGGLNPTKKILRQARKHLAPGGLLVCEIGGNRRALERAYAKTDFAWPELSDPGTVFILEREQLPGAARKAAAPRRRPRRGRARR